LEVSYELGIAGGGPAGCAAAITAARSGKRVLLCEKGRLPRHRVCGEFVSAESHEVLADLLGRHHLLLRAAPRIRGARMFADDNCVEFHLDRPGWSISRFDLDQALWQAALSADVDARESAGVSEIGKGFLQLKGARIPVNTAMNASGRWSNLRQSPSQAASRWIGIKAHFSGELAPPCTDIYFFDGGYCGVQPIAGGRLNASAMVRSDRATSLQEVFASHPQLWTRSRAWEQMTETVTTAPLVHAEPEPSTDGVINVGDAAAFIDPFTGDGISLALRSGVLAAKCSGPEEYALEYQARFVRAFRTAAFARRLSRAPQQVREITAFAFRSEWLRNWVLRNTRGR